MLPRTKKKWWGEVEAYNIWEKKGQKFTEVVRNEWTKIWKLRILSMKYTELTSFLFPHIYARVNLGNKTKRKSNRTNETSVKTKFVKNRWN